MGPGQYSPERGDSLTKTKIRTVNMGSSPARGSFIKKDDANLGPGQYDDRNYEFGAQTKSFTIGEKRQERVVETMGPGTYDPDRADGVTKAKMPNINMGSSPARGSFTKKDDANLGPGQYDDRNYEFGSQTKSFTIGEKRQERVVETMGPGQYSPERGESLTKTTTTRTINMASSPARPASFAKHGDVNVAPGQYDDGKAFGTEAKSFTIGVKRAAKETTSIGPGAYSPERAETITKTKTTTINMGSSPARGSFIKKDDANLGPGQYDDRNYEFGSQTKSFTIGEKR